MMVVIQHEGYDVWGEGWMEKERSEDDFHLKCLTNKMQFRITLRFGPTVSAVFSC